MLQAISVIRTLFSLFPLLIQAIQAIEAAFPNAKQGDAKLDMVKSVIKSAFDTGTSLEATFEQIAPGIDAIVKSAVTIFNAAGAFKTSTPAPAPVLAAAPPAAFDPATAVS